MKFSRRSIFGGSAASLLFASRGASAQAAEPPSISELAREPAVADCAIAPDGKTIAVLRTVTGGSRPVSEITFHPFDDLETVRKVRLSFESSEIAWLSNSRLGCLQEEGKTIRGSMISHEVHDFAIIDRDTYRIRQLSEIPQVKKEGLDFSAMLEFAPEGSERVMMEMHGRGARLNVYSMDLDSGDVQLIERGAPLTVSWTLQHGKPVLRVDASVTGRYVTLLAKTEAGQWKTVRRVQRQALVASDFDVMGADDEAPGVLFVAAYAGNENARALYRFDLKSEQYAGVVSRRDGRDVKGVCTDKAMRFLGATYLTDRIDYEFTDPSLTEHFAELNAHFGNQCNVVLIDASRDLTRIIAFVEGPRESGVWIVFDRKAGGLGYVGNARPWLTPERLAPMVAADAVARDGVRIRTYLTVPLQKGPRPLVVLPHGGPAARDFLNFDLVAQALAAQGWVVLQPNFRGSDGYGRAFAEASHGAWNGRVIEDIEDATDQVVRSGLVDRKRVAIMGMSFGGYAALLGAVRRPDAYCGVVSVAGVSDLPRILRDYQEDGDDSPAFQYWVKQIGHPLRDVVAIRAASPITRIAEFKAPVLLVHGERDRVVSVEQSRTMDQALKRAGKKSEFIEVPAVGHSGWPQQLMGSLMASVTDFLKARFDAVD